MRRTALTSLALAATLALAACGGNGDGGGTADPTGGTEQTEGTGQTGGTAVTEAPEGLPTVDGGYGEQPTLIFPGTGAPEGLEVATLHEGDGEEVPAGSYIVANYIGQVWGAETPFNDSWDMGQPIGFSLERVIQGWSEGIPGANVGDRLLISIPPEQGYGAAGQPAAGIGGEDTLVFVIDVLGSYPADAMYAQADARDTGEIANLPVTISGSLGSQPTIAMAGDGAPEPTGVSATVVAEGSGEPVGEYGLIVVAYHLVSWDGQDGGSSWGAGQPETVPLGAGTPFDSLVGTPVGSRAVLQIPAAAPNPAVAAVVDVLGYIPGVSAGN